jgi:hypothetical protein
MERFTTGDFIGFSISKPVLVEIIAVLCLNRGLERTLGFRTAMREPVRGGDFAVTTLGSPLACHTKIENVAH